MGEGIMTFRAILLSAALLAVPAAALGQGLAPDRPKGAPNPTANRYVEAPDFFKMPKGRDMGASSSVMGDSKGNIWVVDRCAANSCAGSKLDPIMQFDARGNFIKAFGAGLLQFPHGFFIDSKDHLWITDGVPPDGKGNKGHTVMEFGPDGKLLRTMGKVGAPGFRRPHAGRQEHAAHHQVRCRRQVYQAVGEWRFRPRPVRPAACPGDGQQGPSLCRRP
jgi:hypothetical protein